MNRTASFLVDSLAEVYGQKKAKVASDKKLADAIKASLFPKQRNVLDDKARRKAVLCPRRAGKSWTALAYAFDTALRKPGSTCVIICLTLKTAKNIYWNKLVGRFLGEYGISADRHHTDLRITLKNGSIVWFTGAETKAEIEKIRGGAYDLAVIDECKSYPPAVIDELVTDALKPALDDRAGTMLLIGTPGNVLDGLFYLATAQGTLDEKNRPYSRTFDSPERYWEDHPTARVRWSRHTWTRKENTKTEENLWEAALNEKDDNLWSDDHPTWQREYLGNWVPADDCFVYAYATLCRSKSDTVHWTPKRTKLNPHGLPDWPHDWRFILGADLGYEDDFAFVVAAYSATHDSLYQVYDHKSTHTDFYQVVELLQHAWDTFGGFDAMVADASGLGKMVVETISKRHGLPVQAAEKREKWDFVELLNADLHTGRVKLLPDGDLAREMAGLQFDLSKHSKKELARTGKLRENPQLPNHLCDAFLYLHRFSSHYWSKPKAKPVDYGTLDYWDIREREWERRTVAEQRGDQASFWENLRNSSVDPTLPLRRGRTFGRFSS